MLRIEHGATDYQVFQRDERDEAVIAVSGQCPVNSTDVVQVQIATEDNQLQHWREAGKAAAGRWQASILLQTGGPYTVRLRLQHQPEEVVEVKQVLVGDLWVLAGQSNMEGVGDLIDVEQPHPLVHNYTMAESWEVAQEPLHWLCCSVDPAHNPDGAILTEEQHAEWHRTRSKGAGLGLSFAKAMVEATGVPIGLVPCAHGGTSMSQWSPDLAYLGGGSLYGSMLRRVKAVGGRVKGVLWYQGESDANPTDAPLFAERFIRLVERVRADFYSPALPFYTVQIGRFVVAMTHEGELAWNQLQDTQRRLAEQIPHTAVVASVDLELDDLIHIGTQGLKRLGKRLAKVALRELFGRSDIQRGPRLIGAFVDNLEGTRIRVRFADVNGRLTAAGRISGFSIRTAHHHPYRIIYKMEVDKASPTDVLLHLTEPCPKNAFLWYGFGIDPYCNLVDEADMAAPMFGPVPIQRA
ncbi:MAG: sialate O-acetylesterase [Armatimonadota bacterium]|nr:sialate O-acetylesterase [bacterium]MDW8321273.1 sialate O-acetylesterase [Armatimonadota bacterium]